MTIRKILDWLGEAFGTFFLNWAAFFSGEMSFIDMPIWNILGGAIIGYTVIKILISLLRPYCQEIKDAFDI